MPTKSDTPLNEIDVDYAKGQLRQPEWANEKPICAFDTETHDGDVFMLSISHEQLDWSAAIHSHDGEDFEALEPERIFHWLTKPAVESTINVWFNLNFDANVILSVLPEQALQRLHITNMVEVELDGKPYEITYLPGKLLRIRKGRREIETEDGVTETWKVSIEHYDVAQLFRDSLEGAAQEWLGVGKLPDVDTSRFGERDYINEHWDTIRKYARRDADLTMRLTRELIDTAEDEDLGIPTGKPISTGYLAENYLRDQLDRKPGWGLTKMQAMAWDSYAGGRFEVFERGDIGEVAGPDINSAYPAILADLPDPGTLRWGVFADPSIDRLREADYGFVDVTVSTDEARRIQPFAVKIEDVVTFPALDQHRITVLLDTFLFALEADLITDHEVHEASLGFDDGTAEYPFSFVHDLYDRRKTWEAEGREKAALLLKIVLNSLYGKTAQTTVGNEILDDGINPNEVENFTQVLGHAVSQSQRGGAMFNPFIASYITGLTRLELHRAVYETGLEQDTILFATDSIMVREEAYRNSNFRDLLGDRLGEWDFDYRGRAFVVGSGVYEVERTDLVPEDFDSYEDLRETITKTVSRGFREADLDGKLRDAAASAGSEAVPIVSERPRTIGEALFRNELITLEDVGVFDSATRDLSASFDRKREWDNPETTFTELLDGPEGSSPVVLSGENDE